MTSDVSSVSLVGSTGSIGTQAVDVVQANAGRFDVIAIGAHSSAETLLRQAERLHPKVVAIVDESKALDLKNALPSGIEIRAGRDCLESIATEADVVVNSVVGFAGLPVTLAALSSGRRLALANKESLIAAGPLVQRVRGTGGAQLIPVDSEHGALFQCLRAESETGSAGSKWVRRLIITASGGPFRGRHSDELRDVTASDALAHPTWSMGPKITIDSSTLFNKGLEVIEAHELFHIPYDQIEVTVHPQSILHSAVEFSDGSTVAHLSRPDMRLPIGFAMGHPDRLDTPYGLLDWTAMPALTFEPPDTATFRCLDLAYQAGREGGTAPTWLNAANEVAVAAFLRGEVTWLDISSIIDETLQRHDGMILDSLDVVVDADATARRLAGEAVQRKVQI